MNMQNWQDRLSPMPRRIEIGGWLAISPAALVTASPEKDLWTTRAATEFAQFIGSLAGRQPQMVTEQVELTGTCVYFLPPSATVFNGLFEHPFFADFSYYPGFQSYRIAALPGKRGLVVQGIDPEGAYWGMKTLKQLVTMNAGSLQLPRLLVADGAHMEERGIWSQPFGTTSPYEDREQSLAHYKEWIDWMSDHKLNLLEIMTVGEGGGLCYRSKLHPEFNHADAEEREYLLGELICYGKSRGVRMIPIFSHPEHFGFMAHKFPELVPAYSVSHHGQQVKIAVDFFQEKTTDILRDIAAELVARFAPAGLCFWFAENRLHALPPTARKGRSEFMREAETYLKIAEEMRKQAPGLECRILLSQGSFPENLEIMLALPQDVKWIYYSGERFGTYNIRAKNPIHRDIAAAAAAGRWVSLCNALRGIPGRPTHLEAIQRNIGHAIQAGLKGLDGMSYAFPGDKLALTVAAEYSWNCDGRDLPDTLRAAATENGVADVGAQVKAYLLYDHANAAQARRNSQGIGQPFGNFSRFSNMLERIRDNATVDELIMMVADNMETDDIPALAKAAEDVETACSLADPEADRLFCLRCQYLLQVIRVSEQIARAFYINCREKSRDLYKGPWQDYREELNTAFTKLKAEAEQSQSLFADLVRTEGWAAGTRLQGDPLVKTAALAAEIKIDTVSSSRD